MLLVGASATWVFAATVDAELEVLSTGIQPGDLVDLRLTVTNPTPDPVTVTALIPTGTGLSTGDGICEMRGVELASGESEVRDCTYQLTIALDCDPMLPFYVGWNGSGPHFYGAQAIDVVSVPADCPDPWAPAVSATLEMGPGPVPVGATIDPAIHVVNTGSATVGDVLVTLIFEDGIPADAGVIECPSLHEVLAPGDGLDVPCGFVLNDEAFVLNGTFVCDPVVTTQVDVVWQETRSGDGTPQVKDVDVLDISGLEPCGFGPTAPPTVPAPTVPPTDVASSPSDEGGAWFAGVAVIALMVVASRFAAVRRRV